MFGLLVNHPDIIRQIKTVCNGILHRLFWRHCIE
jgi:hypothetical protein